MLLSVNLEFLFAVLDKTGIPIAQPKSRGGEPSSLPLGGEDTGDAGQLAPKTTHVGGGGVSPQPASLTNSQQTT